MAELTRFPEVLHDDGKLYYGGSQDWFFNKWREMSGCASVSAVNLSAFYGIGILPDTVLSGVPVFSGKGYIKEMNLMFRKYMTSGMMGFPDPFKYIDRFKEYSAANGFEAKSRHISGWSDINAPVSFIEERILTDDPLAILILGHSHREIEDITWHWMTVTGIDKEKGLMTVSNYGKKEAYPVDVILEASPANTVHLISFDITKTGGDDPF